jgi:hypothetical protein
VKISRIEIMKLAKIKSVTTFHKCIKQLVQTEYINYVPSYHPAKASAVVFCLVRRGSSN